MKSTVAKSFRGPLFFLVYINDLVDIVNCDIKMFTDDTSLFSCVYDPVRSALELNDQVGQKMEHKHLGVILDSKLDFQSHSRQAISKARRGIGMIRYLSKYVARNVLDQIYKLYVRPHLDYRDIIYHRPDPAMQSHFTQALEQTQYSAALAVTGALRGTSRQRL